MRYDTTDGPELLLPDRFGLKDSRPTKESDCYALGMVIYEVLSGKVPFSGLKDFIVIPKVVEGERSRMDLIQCPGFSMGIGTWTAAGWTRVTLETPAVDVFFIICHPSRFRCTQIAFMRYHSTAIILFS